MLLFLQKKKFFLLLAVLAGCARQPPVTPDQFCAEQAENDPEVRVIIMHGLANAVYQSKSQSALRDARRRAVLACLKRQGVAPPPGGVEPPKRTDTLFR